LGPRPLLPSEPQVIDVVATRYAFTPSEITVEEGDTVRLRVRSGDGPHGFAIAKYKVKKELMRGAEPVTIEFTADVPGRFPIICSEFCGDGHPDMKGALIVNARAAGQ
jgi:cytochrome c oxidase subunit II